MRLGCCLVASDLNSDYLDFFPLMQRVWREVVDLEVRLVLIATALPQALRPFERIIHVFPPVPGLHTAFQAQCVRLLFVKNVDTSFHRFWQAATDGLAGKSRA